MTNFNKWTWADPSYVATTTSSYMSIGTWDKNYTMDMEHVVIAPKTIGGHIFELKEFSFGMYNATNNTEYFVDINNWSTNYLEYGLAANTTQLAMNFRGLGLPTTSFNKFSTYLSVITKGESTCLSRQSGYCALTSPCEYYRSTGLWDFSFKVKFANQNGTDNYFRVPLASFAANYDQLDGVCVIFVEYLDFNNADSTSIILGSMFWQSVYGNFTVLDNAVAVALYKNINALSTAYIGSDVYEQGENVFTVPTAKLMPDEGTERNGLPTFTATIGGITDPHPYFLLDLHQKETVAWGTHCVTTGIGVYLPGPCSDAPTFTQPGFDGSPLPTPVGTFSNAPFSGFVTSGTKYTSQVCFGDVNCKFTVVYGVESISQDNYLYQQDATYGIIGMGPGSFFQQAFVDPETLISTYSIELARVNIFSNIDEGLVTKPHKLLGASGVQSNITFGSANNEAYIGQPSILMPSNSEYYYNVSNFGYGKVYTDNGEPSSQYFYEFGSDYPIDFNTNFKGLGLPANYYSEFVTLLEYTTNGEVSCENSVDGICVLPGQCSDWEALSSYYFFVNFTQSVNGNFLRVPISTFAEKVGRGGGNYDCNININYLNQELYSGNAIVFGGMFFQEYFAIFKNDYHDTTSVDQGTQIYVGQNSIYDAYLGSTVLPEGDNPFVPQPGPTPPAPESSGLGTAWIVVIALIGALLIAFLAFLLYKYKVATA